MSRMIVMALTVLLVPCATGWADMVILPGSAVPATNHALGGTATQSTTAHGRGPENAVDGNIGETGTHTDGGAIDPWWQVVFNGGDQDIAQIVLHNRDSCCAERLRDITVKILDAAGMTDLLVSPVLNPANALGSPEMLEWDVMAANGGALLSGGIVRVERASDPGSTADDANVLTLNEVLALDDDAQPGVLVRDTNLALGKPVSQSTTGYGGAAERAVDGNTDGVFNNGSVTHTAADDDHPWWQVDLGMVREIDGVSLYNRTDCCGQRLSDIQVDVLGADGSTVVGTSGLLNPGNALFGPSILAADFSDDPVMGRYVRVTKMAGPGGDTFVSLAEVEVYGVPEPSTVALLVVGLIGLCVIGVRRRFA